MVAHPALMGAGPAQALRGDVRALRLAADMLRVARAMALPNVWPPAVSATVSSSFMPMRAKGLAHVARRTLRHRAAARPLGVQ